MIFLLLFFDQHLSIKYTARCAVSGISEFLNVDDELC